MKRPCSSCRPTKPMKITWEREIISPIHDDDGNIISAADNAKLRKPHQGAWKSA